MFKKQIAIIISIILFIILAGGIFYYFYFYNPIEAKLQDLKKTLPEFTEFIDEIIKMEKALKKDKTRIENYLNLGLSWKSLADRTRDPEHYQQALKIYQEGIKLTKHKNTVFINNAGHMAEYLENFALAENYYKEAIGVAPGDELGYLNLIDLYRYKLKKSPEEIMAVFDQGIAKMFNPRILETRKKQYLEEIGQ